MSFVTFVSGRYLRTRQKRAFISLITGLSIAGVTVGVMALIVVIAVMAGFEADLKSRILGIRPHLVITRNNGDFNDFAAIQHRLRSIDGIQSATATITSQVVLRTTTRASGAMLKGIDATDGVSPMHGIDISRLRPPSAAQETPESGRALPGILLGKALAANLGVIRGDPIYIISPRGMLSPAGHIPAMVKFQVADLFESGMYEFDGAMAFIGLIQAQKLLRMPASVSQIDIRLTDLDRVDAVARTIAQTIDSGTSIATWKQINRSLFSALRLEKTTMFVILALIVLVAAFNIAGSLVMMVMEKRKDIAILKAMGATARSIGRIFVLKGLTIGLVGTLLGTSTGLLLCFLLARYSFIHLPADVYYITTLPVDLNARDVLMIALCALLICLAATLYPARQAAAVDPVEAIRHG